MVISQERNNAIKEVRSEYMRIQSRVRNEIVRRVAAGSSRFRALGELASNIVNGDFDISSPQAPGISSPRVPSVSTLRQTVEDLQSDMLGELNASRAPISPLISPDQRRGNPRGIVNLGNAVRNLEPVFSDLRSPDARREQPSERSWRTASLNTMRMLTQAIQTRRRNAAERARALNELRPPLHDADIPPFQYDPNTFTAADLTLNQAIRVMNTFDFDSNYERIKLTLLMFSLKIYGLEDCPREDLRLAVFLFIERYFNIQPAIELCVRPIEDHREPNAVGVLLEKCVTVSQIIDNRRVLTKTRYRVSRNHSASWIIWNYDG